MTIDTLRKFSQNYFLWGVVLVFIIAGFVLLHPNEAQMPANEVEQTSPKVEDPVLSESIPIELSIPKINLKTGFEEPLGVQADGSIEVPKGYTEVGWYKFGPTPGEVGPAVILGHVDSYQGPAVFFLLGQLEIGDEINILRADGSTAAFVVTELERNKQVAFPTEKVYGNIDHAGLRLVTCSGTFNKGVQRYSHNLVVYAKLRE